MVKKMNEVITLSVKEVYNYLTSIANQRNNTIRYSAMEEKFGMEHSLQNLQKLTEVLDHTMMYNKMKDEPLLAALVVNEKGYPGKGFYRTLKKLNIEYDNEIDFHNKEIQRIRKFNWKKWD